MTEPGAGQDRFIVVRNDEEQYSIWPADSAPPTGWAGIGSPGTREECLGYIETHWTDMRPRSVREASQ